MNKELPNKEVEVLEKKAVEIAAKTQETIVEQESISVQEISKSKKKGVLKWIVLALAAIIAAVCVGGYVYTNSPSYLAGEQLDLGEKYLTDLDYDQAIVSFKKALEIDPNNAEIRAAVEGHIEEFYQVARGYGKAGEYASEKEIASFILYLKSDSVHGKIADAEADCGTGAFEKAKQTYEEVRGGGVDEADVEEGIQYCEAILQLLAYCETKQWENALKYVEGEEITAVIEKDATGERIIHTGNVTIAFGNIGNGRYVYCGDIIDGAFNGTGVGMVASVNTYSIYEGEWSADMPNGIGKLIVWEKLGSKVRGNEYSGSFLNGLLDGNGKARYWVIKENVLVDLNIIEGQVPVFQVDEEGNIWITDKQLPNKCNVILEYSEEKDGFIADYIVGLPEFGGSDKVLYFGILDRVAPVFISELEFETEYGYRYYWGDDPTSRIGRDIMAKDNYDGDVTDKITYTSSESRPNSWSTRLTIVCSVKDNAGNEAKDLTVVYEIVDFCGDWEYRVVSIDGLDNDE